MQRLDTHPSTILITGIMAAGKSTVAQALAERLERSVHLRGDLFRRAIVNGRAHMGSVLSEEARKQLLLRYQLAAQAAKLYMHAGFSVVYQDIILGDDLNEVSLAFRGQSLYMIALCPASTAVAQREQGPDKTGYTDVASIDRFDRALRTQTPRVGLWLDNSTLTVAETVDRILSGLPSARIAG